MNSLTEHSGRHITTYSNPPRAKFQDKSKFVIDLSKPNITCRRCKKSKILHTHLYTEEDQKLVRRFKEKHSDCKKPIKTK